jgi:hypothetical protein
LNAWRGAQPLCQYFERQSSLNAVASNLNGCCRDEARDRLIERSWLVHDGNLYPAIAKCSSDAALNTAPKVLIRNTYWINSASS